MRHNLQKISLSDKRGMTLAEVVIAIAIISFSIPLILAATGEAHRSRQSSETDTRSAWLLRDAQRRIIHMWSENTPLYGLSDAFPFPSAAAPSVSIELSYKQDGTLLADGLDQAVYLVSVQAEPYIQTPDRFTTSPLALVSIKIQHPANKRTILTYQFLSTRDGIL